jgi:hypothetical protein
MDALMKIDGDKVRVLRERKAWSQEHLATVSGLSARTIRVMGALAGVTAGMIGVLNECARRRQASA